MNKTSTFCHDLSDEYNSSPAYKTFLLDTQWHSRIIGFLVGVLMIAIYVWIVAGVVDVVTSLYQAFFHGWAGEAEHMIKTILILFALLEFIRVLQSYLLEYSNNIGLMEYRPCQGYIYH